MKKKIITLIFLLLTLIWMCVIFSFSCENASESSESSGSFIEKIASVIIKDFDTFSEEEKTVFIERYEHFTRKAAHFTIYAILGALSFTTVFSYSSAYKKSYFIALIIGALYAVSDEIHQYFVPGRACMIKDMLLDSCGVAFGAAVILLFVFIIRKKHSKSIKS